MGHLINPISTRLGFSSYWLSSWTDFSLNKFSYNLMLDWGFSAIIEWAFAHSWLSESMTRYGLFLSHYRVLRRGSNVRAHVVFIYNSGLLLKASFVEANIVETSIDWVVRWAKQHRTKKAQHLISARLHESLRLLENIKRVPALVSPINQRAIFSMLRGRVNDLLLTKKPKTFKSTKRFKGSQRQITGVLGRLMFVLKKFQATKVLYQVNTFFSKFIGSLFTQFLNKTPITRGYKFSVGLKFLSRFNIINPQFIARFIARRVTYGFALSRVIRPIIKDLTTLMHTKNSKIIGFRLACSGRFDRRQIATYVWQKFGPVSLNKFAAQINYGFATAYLKYGACGIKVWIASDHRVLRSQLARQQGELALFKINKPHQFNEPAVGGFAALRDYFVLFDAYWNDSVALNRDPNNGDFRQTGLNAVRFNEFLQLLITQWLQVENRTLLGEPPQ